MVCQNLVLLRYVCIQLWQYFLDDIVKCRNYYLANATSGTTELYRAVHFELEIEPNRWIELQVLTELRDWIGFLDHSFTFKKRLRFLNREHEQWLTNLSANANIADARAVDDNSVMMPLNVIKRSEE